ncbi:helix-turn-helix domain-containing protein [Kineococcus sp. R86509]|uniref:helix-turn-helix domain-containing protein n=1 Tax=Kineococcus sp. R86509 TaxID=3093851 RepID=UPI0036D377F4
MSIAGRLESLIASVERTGRGALDSQHIAALTHELGHPLTSSYISQLRRGSRTNPTIDSLRVLAAVFGVPVSYFFPHDTAPDDQPWPTPGAETRPGAGGRPADSSGRSSSLATSLLPAKLAELFERSSVAEGRPLSVEEVAKRCQASGYEVTECYLTDLLNGVKDNPSIRTLEGIAQAFDVHVSFFFMAPTSFDADQDADQSDRVYSEAMKDEAVRDIARRSSELDPAGRRLLAAMLRELSDVKITRNEPTPPPGLGEG